jgi:CRP-like cAMP-binding protein
MPAARQARQNLLLDALPAQDFARIASGLEQVPMLLGDMLYEPGEQLQHAYFPTTAIVSLHYVMESGDASETAGVGNEGVVGISLFMGGGSTLGSAVVQTAGHAWRLERRLVLQEFNRGGPVQALLLRYTMALMAQLGQAVACNRHHSIEQRLCRWLLFTLDRVASPDLVITQELIAGMLGTRREGITEAAGALQRAGAISNRRGHISVTDRSVLEARTCECYVAVKTEVDRLLRCVSSPALAPAAARR